MWAKAMESTVRTWKVAVLKNPPAYGERNARKADLGTGETPAGLLATPMVTDLISGEPAKGKGKPAGGVGGVHSTDDGKDNITLPEGRDPTLSARPKRVRARECHRLTTP